MTDTTMRPIRRALLSVSDKTGIVELARALADRGVEILSTGRTHRALAEAGIAAREVAQYTGSPEMMDGRVKTLHPKIHGGILGRRGTDDAVMAQHGIAAIDLVVVNLYPFEATIARPDVTAELAVENIDIGGPAMIRSAAKNHADVLVIVDPNDYDEVRAAIAAGGTELRAAASVCRQSVLAHGAIRRRGCVVSVEWRRELSGSVSICSSTSARRCATARIRISARRCTSTEAAAASGTVAGARATAGQGAVVQQRRRHRRRARVRSGLRRTGVRDRQTRESVRRRRSAPICARPTKRAYATDPTSAYGGIIAFNRTLDAATLEAIVARQFVEVVIAPEIEPAAVEVAKRRKNVRVLACGALVVALARLRVEAGRRRSARADRRTKRASTTAR